MQIQCKICAKIIQIYASPTNSFICLMHNSCKKMLDLCKIYAIYIHIIARLMQMINATFVQD